MLWQTSIDGCIITAEWYARPASMDASSPSDRTPSQRRWMHHHHRMVRQASVDGHIITAGWYAEQVLKVTLSLPDDTPIRR
jgi:hypothetical protein